MKTLGGTAQGRGETLSPERGVCPVATELPLNAVERVRRFAATLGEIIPICENSLTQILEAGQRVLFQALIFSGIVYAIYRVFRNL